MIICCERERYVERNLLVFTYEQNDINDIQNESNMNNPNESMHNLCVNLENHAIIWFEMMKMRAVITRKTVR